MKLDKSPFVIISVIGQELLAQGKYNNAVEVLESALKIDQENYGFLEWASNSDGRIQVVISFLDCYSVNSASISIHLKQIQ